MTNAQTIFNESVRLMKDGIIGTTGNKITITYEKDGQNITEVIDEPEPIHTFAAWKSLGFKVKKGEKSIAKIDIWKCTIKPESMTSKDEHGEEVTITEDTKNMFRKTAYFFKLTQVEPITA